jgi:hypothetical protein
MNKPKIFISTGLLFIGLIFTCIGLLGSIKDTPNTKYQQYQKYKDKETRLIIHNRILEDSVADLEVKLRILNNCLHKEQLEYLDVCNLVDKKSK